MIIFVTLLFIFLFPASASSGEFYKWVDKKGSVHFTDNYQQIPREYRDQVETRKMPDTRVQKSENKPALEKTAPVEKVEKRFISEGSKIFNRKCSKCHSLTGKNPKESVTKLTGLLYRKSFKEHLLPVTEDNIKKVIIEGGWDDMPAFPELDGDGIEELMKFLYPYLIKEE
ncbi:MAG: DUF4124 domain-containing protein [Candidatus Binatia bacterium]